MMAKTINKSGAEMTSTLLTKSSYDYTIESIKRLYEVVFADHPLENIFLRYEWMSTWITCASSKPELVTFISPCETHTIGFAFIGCKNTPFGKEFFLNQTGNKQDDQIWIEYNDVICAQHHQACRDALLAHVFAKPTAFRYTAVNCVDKWQNKQWRSWSSQSTNGYLATNIAADIGGNIGTKIATNSAANTDNTTGSANDVKSTKADTKISLTGHFSKNTKSQVSRSMKYIEQQFGAVQMHWLTTHHIEAALTEMGSLHIEQWEHHDYGSGFTNPQFVEFHRQFMRGGLPDEHHQGLKDSKVNVHLAKFTAADLTLGYLYFFTYQHRVYFYLSAINYHSKDNKYKPGLLMHKFAMTHFADLGYTHYDFLAGDSRYKSSLSNEKYLLHNMQLYVNKWYYQPVKFCVNIKRLLFQRAI